MKQTMAMLFRDPKPLRIVVLLLTVLTGLWKLRHHEEDSLSGKPERLLQATEATRRERPPRYRTTRQWQREVETIFGDHEAGRSRILSRKVTVDAEIYLLAVELPSPDGIRSVREKLAGLMAGIAPENRAAAEGKLAELVREYDPFGEGGRRVIQIDVPDEPNGRLTGFTCTTDDFAEITARFVNGEMTDQENLRGYAASYAGMPLTRFHALMATEDPLGLNPREIPSGR